MMGISKKLTYADLFRALVRVAKTVGRPVNPTAYTVAGLSKRTREKNAFLTRVLKQAKLWVVGSEHEVVKSLPAPPEGAAWAAFERSQPDWVANACFLPAGNHAA